MTLAHRQAVDAHDVAEDAQPGVFAQLLHHHREPVLVLGLDAQAAFPPRVSQISKGLGQLVLLDEARVVGLHEHVDARADPVAVRLQRLRHQVLEVLRAQRLQAFLAIQRLHLRAVGLDQVGVAAAGAHLGHRALQHLLRVGAPGPELDAVLLLERRGERRKVLGHERGVEHHLAFFLRGLHDFRRLGERWGSEEGHEEQGEFHSRRTFLVKL